MSGVTSLISVSGYAGRDFIVSNLTVYIAEARFELRSSASGIAQPILRQPSLDWFPLSDAFEDDKPNLFSLLRWDFRLVETLFGREHDLREILKWAESGFKTPSARLITGEGGAGKTRLAATAAQILRKRGWTAGFLPRANALIDFTVGAKGLFLILDYPEEQPERTAALLSELAERRTAPYPLRVMFLSRRSFAEWERETTILQGRFGRQEIAAPAPLSVDDGTRLIEEAARNFATHTQKPMPDLGEARRWLEASPPHRLPLYATAAAIHAVLSPREAFGLAGGELLKNLAHREIHRVRQTSEALGLGQEGLERFLGLGVLADGLTERAVSELAKAGLCDSSKSDIVEALARSPWWKNGRLSRLEPDAPAAAFLDSALFFSPKFPKGRAALSDWMFIALQENAATFGNRLGRILYDLHTLRQADERGHPLDERLLQMVMDKPERAASFAGVATSKVPFWAANFAAEVALIIAERAAVPEEKALYFNNAANYLSALGRREDALAAAQEAVNLYRELARARPDAFTPDLAGSLNTLANSLSALGRHEEALAAAQEAVNLYRELARARPDAFRLDLAGSLDTLANSLSALGRREEALAALQEVAVNLCRELARARPDAFTLDLAGSFDTLANSLSALGRHEETLAAAQEAVNLYRELADAFTPDLAGSLDTLASGLSALGRHEEALAALQEELARAGAAAQEGAQEFVNFYRELARARPDAFTPDLAVSLDTLAIGLSNLGRHEEALAAAQEAVNLYRELARARPDAFTPDLAGSLNTLANSLSALGRREEALAAAQEAVNLYRELARARPDAFTPDLAGSLDTLANRLSALGRREEALAAAQEAVNLGPI